MPFIKRDTDGKILAVYANAVQKGLEQVNGDDPQLIEFLYDGNEDAASRKDMLESDLGLARVLEDLIDLLIEKGTFRFTDLPNAAQEKLLARRGLRKEFAYVETLFSEEEDDFPSDGSGGGGFL
ncbi:MAG: hypothetical protein HQ504_02965 [Rhodospirillaceae bacterium]|nr:hypothetical protein [Rhodospirillaceae bacterium]